MTFKYKQVLIVRKDLEMSCGKIAVQVAHASIMAAEECRKRRPEWFNQWLQEGQKKVVLKVKDEKELLEIYNKARSENLPVALVIDAGLTEIPPGTKTAVGIGPAPQDLIDKVTGHLRLL